MGSLTFTTTLLKRGPAAAVVLDDQQVAAVGEGAKRFPVAATINGHTWRSTVVKMRGEFLLGLSKDVRGPSGRRSRRRGAGRADARPRGAARRGA